MKLDSREAATVYRRLSGHLRAEGLRLESSFPHDDEMLIKADLLILEADKLNDVANELWEAKTDLHG